MRAIRPTLAVSRSFLRTALLGVALVSAVSLSACGGDSGVKKAAAYNVGGSVSGLVGKGLSLQNNGTNSLAVSANGTFTFSSPLTDGSSYAVTVSQQPTNPSQNCIVTQGTGSISGGAVTNVAVTCTTNGFTVGGNVTGLTGSGLVLLDNNGDPQAVTQSGPFTFSKTVGSGSPYAVTVGTQPTNPTQTCSVTGGSGTIGSANVANVAVQCTTNNLSVSGTITGLLGTGLVLQTNGQTIPITGSNFTISLPSGTAYNVQVTTQPTSPPQICVVANGSGTLTNANVTGVTVTCNKYTVSVTVSGLVGGATGMAVLNNGGNSLAVTGNGTFTFSQAVTTGQPYAVTVGTQPTATPAEYCIPRNGAGTIANANINVAITCRKVGQALFVANANDGVGNVGSVGGYAINATTGNLTAAAGSPYAVNGGDLNPNWITLDAGGQFAYVANLNSSNLSTFSVVPATGVLTFVADTQTSISVPFQTPVLCPVTPSCQTFSVAVSPDGKYAFAGSDESPSGFVDGYTLAGGALTAVTGNPFVAGNDPTAMIVDPTSTFLFAPEQYDDDIAVFTIGTGGVLSAATYFPSGVGSAPKGVALLPPQGNGQPGYLFVANSGTGTVAAFSYDGTTGALTNVSGSPYTVGTGGATSKPWALTVDPTGRFLYVVAYGDNAVSAFSINPANGQLTAVGAPVGAGTGPRDVKVEPSGEFAYVANYYDNTIDIYSIDPVTGALTLVNPSGAVPTGTNPISIAIE